MGTPRLVLVTGPAGSGKTTLAHSLGQAIGCPALSRDEIKEGMVASHPGFEAVVDDPLTRRTYGLFFELIDRFLAAEVTLVAEAAFQHRIWVQGLETLTAAYDLRVLRCCVEPAMAAERMQTRLASQGTRAAHTDAAHLSAAAPFDPIHLDVPAVDVDTTDGYSPSIVAIVRTLSAG